MTDSMPIKVVDVYNDRELAINAGTDRGIEVDTLLRIVGGEARAVRDPETGEVLGEIVRTKAVLRVYEAQPRFALARTFRTHEVNVAGSGALSVFEAPRWQTRVETLSGVPSDASSAPVEVGDVAEVISSAETTDVPSLTARRLTA